jgi:hypothetical protein
MRRDERIPATDGRREHSAPTTDGCPRLNLGRVVLRTAAIPRRIAPPQATGLARILRDRSV